MPCPKLAAAEEHERLAIPGVRARGVGEVADLATRVRVDDAQRAGAIGPLEREQASRRPARATARTDVVSLPIRAIEEGDPRRRVSGSNARCGERGRIGGPREVREMRAPPERRGGAALNGKRERAGGA